MIGKHIIVDMFDINSDKFININKNDESIEKWNSFIKECFDQANISLLNISWHNFDNNGAFTAIYLLSESHLSIHTWPEYNYIALDVFTCGNSDTQLIVDKVINYFKPKYTNINNLERGQKK
jgi:S-adenosylmethionine decarboxylase proenzyme